MSGCELAYIHSCFYLFIFISIYIFLKTMTGIWFSAFLCTTTQKQARDSFGLPPSLHPLFFVNVVFSVNTSTIKRPARARACAFAHTTEWVFSFN
ncbi:Uncharacterized protein TCM_032562 [Theobroma cacao]|uniref:Uncharacterized protein n=1 Tax=Theobroma cacao TaxID=3641 RepID=A0A061FAD8_THECC|nr:Uncharacterized protein TCM_032562 [Theobroma cacao]